MRLTPERKELIDSMAYYTLRDRWRLTRGDPLLEGETGVYCAERLKLLAETLTDEAREAGRLLGLED